MEGKYKRNEIPSKLVFNLQNTRPPNFRLLLIGFIIINGYNKLIREVKQEILRAHPPGQQRWVEFI